MKSVDRSIARELKGHVCGLGSCPNGMKRTVYKGDERERGIKGYSGPRRAAPDPPGPLPLGSFHTKALIVWGQKGQVRGSHTQKVLEITCFCLCLASAGFLQNPARIPVRGLVVCSRPVLYAY